MNLKDTTMHSCSDVLHEYFGYSTFRPGQQEIIETFLTNRDCLVLLPTGGGKSLCYQIPALMKAGVALIVSPLISLMKDQVDRLQKQGVYAVAWNSNTPSGEDEKIIEDCRAGRIKMLYVSPERLLSLNSAFLNAVPWSFIAIDEAHCVSQWGHDFRPEYAKIGQLRKLLPALPFLALTATADEHTRVDIIKQLKMTNPAVFVGSFDRPNLSLNVRSDKSEAIRHEELTNIVHSRSDVSGIIYCSTRKTTEELSKQLRNSGIRCRPYHAGMSLADRNKIQDLFLSGQIPLVCATIAFGMGIDKADIRYIVHYNLPRNMESYYQEIGRAGRDGNASDTFLFYREKDVRLLRRFALESGRVELNLKKLENMIRYVYSSGCRRSYLLKTFGEIYTGKCDNCDRCRSPRKTENSGQAGNTKINELKNLRSRLARKLRISEMEIASEQLLEKISRIKPTEAGTIILMREINLKWMELYGKEVLESLIIEHPVPEQRKLDPKAYKCWMLHMSGYSVAQISTEFKRQERTIATYLKKVQNIDLPVQVNKLASTADLNLLKIGLARGYRMNELFNFTGERIDKKTIEVILHELRK